MRRRGAGGMSKPRPWGGLTLGASGGAWERTARGGGGGARAPRVGGEWLRVESRSKKGRAYFFNKLTGETSWTPPVLPAHQRNAARSSLRPASAPASRSRQRGAGGGGGGGERLVSGGRAAGGRNALTTSSRPASAALSQRGGARRSRAPSHASNARAAAAASASAQDPATGLATGLAALENDPSFVPSWMKDAKKGNIKVAEEKLALQKSKVLYPVPAVPMFSWNSTSRGIVSDEHDRDQQAAAAVAVGKAGKAPGKAGGGAATLLDSSSRMEGLNASRQTSFGNRVRCMPDNPSRAGDNAWQISTLKPFVSVDAYSSTIVKDLIFGSASSQFD